MAYPRLPVAPRLAAKSEPMPNGCICWAGSRNPKGYGSMVVGNRRRHTHVLAWELVYGPVPEGMVLDHLCRNPACLNPDHLEAVTRRENTLRGLAPTALNAAKTTCLRGHVFDETNTRLYRGRRNCRACERERTIAKRRRGA